MRRIGSYTTARVSCGRVERVEQHTRRLRRDAARLGLEAPDPRAIESLLVETARRAFGSSSGIVRVEWSALPGHAPELEATHRELRGGLDRWRARISATVHPGPEDRHNTKRVDVEAYDLARKEAAGWGVDEVLLLDAQGRVIEGAVSNCVLVDSEGRLRTPALELGPVEGLGLSILRANRREIAFDEFSQADLFTALEILCVNSVRGVVPVVELEGRPVGTGEPGVWANRLRAQFGHDE